MCPRRRVDALIRWWKHTRAAASHIHLDLTISATISVSMPSKADSLSFQVPNRSSRRRVKAIVLLSRVCAMVGLTGRAIKGQVKFSLYWRQN